MRQAILVVLAMSTTLPNRRKGVGRHDALSNLVVEH